MTAARSGCRPEDRAASALLIACLAAVVAGAPPVSAEPLQEEQKKTEEGQETPDGSEEILGAPPAFGAETAERPRVEVSAGSPLRGEPGAGAVVLAIIDADSELPELERRGDWVRVRYLGIRGWVRTGEEGSAPAGSSARPAAAPAAGDAEAGGTPGEDRDPAADEPSRAATIMIPAMGASRTGEETPGDLGQEARELLADSATERAIGPWTLLTDVEDPELLEAVARLASEVPRAYREQLGLEPLPGPAPGTGSGSGSDGASETSPVARPADLVVLVDRERDFRRLPGAGLGQALFQRRGGPRGNVAVLCRCGLADRELYSLFVHETVRLLNRRVFDGPLPDWLGEGLAYGLAFGRIDASGALDEDALGGSERVVAAAAGRGAGGETTENTGGRLALLHLKQEHDRGRPTKLASLVSAGSDASGSAGPTSDLRARTEWIIRSAMFVRFLLDERNGELRDGFRAYLRSVAGGGAAGEEALLDALGSGWETLDGRFRRWVDFQARWLHRRGP